jgi:pyridoxal 5'-phosphate synthase pdxS subunit
MIAEVSKGLGEAMVGIEINSIPQEQLMAGRGW